MTEKKKNELIEKFKTDHIKWVSDKMMKEGELGPIITVLAMKKATEKMGLVFAPIMGDFSEGRKEEVVSKVIPFLFDQLKDDGLIPYCFSFASEVDMRIINTEEELPHNIKDIKSTDALLITFETREETSVKVFDMEKVGKAINEDGEMIDQIKLTYHQMPEEGGSYGGRFTNIFKKYES